MTVGTSIFFGGALGDRALPFSDGSRGLSPHRGHRSAMSLPFRRLRSPTASFVLIRAIRVKQTKNNLCQTRSAHVNVCQVPPGGVFSGRKWRAEDGGIKPKSSQSNRFLTPVNRKMKRVVSGESWTAAVIDRCYSNQLCAFVVQNPCLSA